MTSIPPSGVEPGQGRLNGPQTTGRNYRNLSQPARYDSELPERRMLATPGRGAAAMSGRLAARRAV